MRRTARPWSIRAPDPVQEQELAQALSVGPLTARVLKNRGLSRVDEARRFLEARLAGLEEPQVFPQMEAAVQRLLQALERRELIVVYGDYDVDGLTGACLLTRFLRALGGQVHTEIPDRLGEGYGFNPAGLGRVVEQQPGVLITVDHGVTAHAAIRTLTGHGIDVLVTDHHQVGDGWPDALAVLHPEQFEDEHQPARYLSGAGVAFKLACGLFQAVKDRPGARGNLREILKDGMAFAAMGTIADIVPLVGENRLLVRHGLRRLEVTATPGLKALLRVAGLSGRELDSEDVSFGLAPRLNAAGRMGQVGLARDLLLTDSAAEAERLARRLDALNQERKTLEARVADRARELAEQRPADEPVLCLADAQFHAGVIGIVASRLVDAYHKPTVLISTDNGVAKGSGRSVPGFDLARALRSATHCLESHGGHAAAAGLEMDPARVPELRAALCSHHLEGDHAEPDRALDIDGEVHLHQVTSALVRELARVGPFGEGNRRPLFAASGVELAAPARRVGKDGAHLQLKLRYPKGPLSAIAFQQGHRIDETRGPGLSLVFTPMPSYFRGSHGVELRVEDLRTEEA